MREGPDAATALVLQSGSLRAGTWSQLVCLPRVGDCLFWQPRGLSLVFVLYPGFPCSFDGLLNQALTRILKPTRQKRNPALITIHWA